MRDLNVFRRGSLGRSAKSSRSGGLNVDAGVGAGNAEVMGGLLDDEAGGAASVASASPRLQATKANTPATAKDAIEDAKEAR